MKRKNEQETPEEKQTSLCEVFVREFGGNYLEYAESILMRGLCAALSENDWNAAREIEYHLGKLGII